MGILYLFKSKFKRQLSRIKDNLKSITVINLNNKKINDKRFKKLLKLIKYSNKLKELHLRNNRITNANAEELIVCLEKGDFPYLEVIDLENNYIDQKHILNIEYILTFRVSTIYYLLFITFFNLFFFYSFFSFYVLILQNLMKILLMLFILIFLLR